MPVRIATTESQSRIASLEREIEDGNVRARVRARQLKQSDQRAKQLEDDLDKSRRVCFSS